LHDLVEVDAADLCPDEAYPEPFHMDGYGITPQHDGKPAERREHSLQLDSREVAQCSINSKRLNGTLMKLCYRILTTRHYPTPTQPQTTSATSIQQLKTWSTRSGPPTPLNAPGPVNLAAVCCSQLDGIYTMPFLLHVKTPPIYLICTIPGFA
jgi:hypothetical protein